MSTLLTGGCMCGAVRYEYDGEIGPSSYCHCDDCKRATIDTSLPTYPQGGPKKE